MCSVIGRVCEIAKKYVRQQSEHQLLASLAVLPGGSQFSATYSTLITPLNTLFTSLHSQILNTIKRALHKHTFLALSTYSALSSPVISARWDDIMQRRAGRGGGTGGGIESGNQNALRESLHALRGVCLRSFPEFLADVKLAATSTTVTAGLVPAAVGSVQTGVVDITETVSGCLQDCEHGVYADPATRIDEGRKIYGGYSSCTGSGWVDATHARRRKLEDG